MSIGRDLEKQFQQTNNPETANKAVSELLGITAKNMGDIIVSDIAGMIEQGFREALEGYVLCLSRIIKHDTAWKHIAVAFNKHEEKVPQKYYALFGQDPDQLPQKKKFQVS